MDRVIATCRKTWRSLGVPRDALDEMLAELSADLAEAEADGVSAEAYVGHDARAFARRWAEERGVARPRFHLAGTALTAVLGGIPGAGLGLFFAYGLSSDAMAEIFGTYRDGLSGGHYYFEPHTLLILSLYGIAGLCVALGAFLAARSYLGWRGDLALHETTTLLALAVIPAVALGAGAAVLFAWERNFATTPRTVIGEAVIAVVVFGAAIAATRALAVIRTRDADGSHASRLGQPGFTEG